VILGAITGAFLGALWYLYRDPDRHRWERRCWVGQITRRWGAGVTYARATWRSPLHVGRRR